MADEAQDQTQDSGEGISQADIDAMMAGAGGDAPTPDAESPESPTPEADPTGDPQAINQADIDALMGNQGADEAVPAPSDAPEEQASEGVKQSDIDALLAGAEGESSAAPESVEAAAGEATSVDQSDIDALLNAAGAVPEEAVATAPESQPDTRTDTLGRPFDADAAAMQAAIEEERAEAAAATPAPEARPSVPAPSTSEVTLQDFAGSSIADVDPKRVTMLNDVSLRVKIELGRTRMLLEDVLKLDDGSVVELDKLAGDPVDVIVNDRLVARGEVLILNDSFCVRISEVLSHDPHRVSA